MRLFHAHKWDVASAANGHEWRENPEWKNPVTFVLYRCDCGKYKSERIDGNWAQQITVVKT